MKKLFILFSLVICISAYSVQDSAKYVTNSNVEKLADKYIDKISTSLATLAQGLKQPADHVYKILIRQEMVWGISSLMFLIVSFTSMIFVFKIGNKDDWDNIAIKAWCTISIMSFTVALIWFLVSGMGSLFNPEYGAIQSIISVFK
jgi:hypothetical protein